MANFIHITSHKKRSISYSFSTTLLLLLLSIQATPNKNVIPSKQSKPQEISVHLHINKIYNINTVDETYQIDGYLEYSWIDNNAWFNKADSIGSLVYENDKAKEIIDTKIWFPEMELINIQGSKETPNIGIEIFPNGKVVYEERFFGKFGSYMNFRNFPFDSQSFNVIVEAFSYDQKHMVFVHPEIFLDKTNDSFSEKWDIIEEKANIVSQPYPEEDSEDLIFSRVVFEVNAKRLTGYYLWQVLFPLFIIIMASFVIFWIKDFGTQIGIGFTLMLTVVAFNFYSASILPKLPYQTFIETVIIVGYIFIFLGIISVVINHRVYGDKNKPNSNTLLKYCQFIFPLTFFAAMLILFFAFNIN